MALLKNKVAVYARVSTEEQHTSIENQHDIFTRWIEKNDCVLYDTYTDEAISGTKGVKRKDWQRLIQDGRDRKYSILLAKSFSRFGRNQRETLDAISQLRALNIRVVFIEDNLDSQKDANNFGLFAWLAEQESQRTSERLKLIWKKYNEDGIIHVCIPPYGYDYSPEIRNFVINSEEAEVIRKIFGLYINGYGCTKIANILRNDGIKSKKGGTWANNTIRKMISNETYIGTLIQGFSKTIDVTISEREQIPEDKWYRHANNHPSIITDEIFYKVQRLVEERSSKAKKFYVAKTENKGNSRSSNASLFSNLLKCGECGSTMSIKRKKKLNNYQPFYNCVDYELKGVNYCGHTSNFIWEHFLIMQVKEELIQKSKNDFAELKEILKNNKSISAPKTVEVELKTVNAKIESHLKLSMNLQINHDKGLIGDTQFKLQNEMIESNLNTLLKRKEELEKVPKLENKINEEEILKEGINELLSIPTEDWTNALLKIVIDKIVVYMDGFIDITLKYLNNQRSHDLIGILGSEFANWIDRLLPIPMLEEDKISIA